MIQTSYWTTGISEITPEEIFIRGYAMSDLVGKVPFTAIGFLLLRGHLAKPGEARMMDVLCSSILDYGLQKSATLAARSVVSVNPVMTAGLATGVLGAGAYAVSPEPTGAYIEDSFAKFEQSGGEMKAFAEVHVAELRAAKQRVPGFGHPVFKGVDPRAQKLRGIAVECGIWGEKIEWYEAVHTAFRKAANKPDLVMNDVGMMAAIMAQMGFSPKEMEGLAVLSTFPGLIAHISEEMQGGAINRMVKAEDVENCTPRRSLKDDLISSGWA